MKYFLDLFSGIGGFALGACRAGHRFDAHYFSEVDDYAIKVYRKRFPDAIGLGSICDIKGTDLPEGEWILAGGFPCQDISVAGKGAGLDGGRSGLWFEYARLIGELRPRFAVMENVGAITVRGLDRVLGSLAALGYDAEWQDIRASDVGAPHRRERIWIIAYPMVNADSERCEEQLDGFTAGTRNPYSKSGRENVADADEIMRNRRRRTRDGRAESANSGETLADSNGDGCDKRRKGISSTRWDGAFGNDWWSTEPGVGRVAHGIPSRVDRLKCLGNSIVPEIAELIFKEMLYE